MNFWKRFFGHLHTINRHRRLVRKYAFKVGIGWLGMKHDLSKYSAQEFVPGVKYYLGTASPTQKERKENGYSLAWMHHKGRNKHHHEYWTDYNDEIGKYVPIEMPIKYVKEMFCDRIAASKVYKKELYTDSSPLEYFHNKLDKDVMHENTQKLLESWLVMLSTKGEKETFKYIKKIKNK